MTKDNKQQELSDSTDTAIAYSTCYVQCGDNLELLKSQPNESVNMIYCDILYGTGRNFGDYQDLNPIRSEIESHYLPRLTEMKRVLKQDGSIYLHMDYHIVHWLRCLMDDVFGYKNFVNEIIWCYEKARPTKYSFKRVHDNILFYQKTKNNKFNTQYVKRVRKKDYETNYDGKICPDWWNDIASFGTVMNAPERVNFNTQKPKELIRRMILASTNEGDVVADYYLGSGTTAKVCQELNRKFIGCDLNPKAIEITKARLNGGQ